MQLSKVNSANFKGNRELLALPMGPEERVQRESQATERLAAEEKFVNFNNTVNRANNNVRLLTLLSSGALLLGVVSKGNKLINPAMNFLVTAGETVAKGTTKVVGGLISKINKNFSVENFQKSVEEIARKLRDTSSPDEKMLGGIKGFVDKVFPGKGEAITGVFKKLGAVNPVGLFRTGIATAFGLSVANKAADKVEGALDDAEINRAKNDLFSSLNNKDELMNTGFNTMFEIADTLGIV